MGNPLLGGSMKDLFLGGLPLEKKNMVDHYSHHVVGKVDRNSSESLPANHWILKSTSIVGYHYLVGGFKHMFFSIICGIILPIDELIFFKMVIAPPTR